MSRGRFGGFRVGKKRYIDNWNTLKSENVAAPETIQDLDYTKAKGIWNLKSTMQFPKSQGPSYSLGLSASLDTVSGTNDAWSQRTVDISAYAGATVYLVFEYVMTVADFTADLQLDAINLDGTTYGFENTGESFQTSTTDTASYGSVSWSSLAVGTTGGRWNVDTGGTPSGSTARTDAAAGSYYVYAESSSPANVVGFKFWLRSPQVTLSGSPTLSYYEARNGASIGTLNVYLDVIS